MKRNLTFIVKSSLALLWACVFSFHASLWAQPSKVVVRGVVKHDSLALAGVTVKYQQDAGVLTDQEGRYEIEAPRDAVLAFSYIGYTEQLVDLSRQALVESNVIALNVLMVPDESALDEVVVVAFGKQKKQDLIGAVSSINPGELKVPSSNLTTALAGRIAGIISYQRSGEPGADNADFFIRGVTTFGYKKDPLILIDGIEVTTTDLARLQPDDIATFSIMKDATATSLYGARGANGVILITTKEGKEGRVSISLRAENSISRSTKQIELADPITYMKLGNEAIKTRKPSDALRYPQSKIDNTIAGANPFVFPATDWQEELFRDNALNQRINLNVSGGGAIARYYLAGTFNKDNGNLKVNQLNNFNSNIDLRTYSLRSNVNINITKTTEAVVRLSGSFDDYNGPIDGGTEVYNQVMHTNPVLFPAYFVPDEAHDHVKHVLFGNYGPDAAYINPYANLMKGYKEYARSKMDAQFEVKQDLSFLTEGWAIRGLFNTSRYAYFDVVRQYSPFYYSVGSYNRRTDQYTLSSLNETSGTEYLGYQEGLKQVNSTVYLEAATTYNRTFAEKHGLSGMLVFIMRSSIVGNAGDLQQSLPFRNSGLSGRATYAFDNRYYAEFNFGYNGSERFYKTNRFGFFPSAGVAWNVSNEAFWAPVLPVVNKLKFRATYGLVGNDAIGSDLDRFFYLSNVNMNTDALGARFGTNYDYYRSGVGVSRYSNTAITWEKAKKTNIGMELSLFNKLNIEADYFSEYRTNILMDRAFIPTTMGLSAPVRANVGAASAKGIDGSIDYTHSVSSDLWLKGRANFTYAASEFRVFEEPNYTYSYLRREGKPLSQQWGYIAERLFVDDNEALNAPPQNFGEYRGGDIKYHDVNGDGKITTLDRVPIGFPTDPEIIYGFGVSTGYKGFDLSFFFQGSARSSFWIDPVATAPFVNETQLLKVYADNHWAEDNQQVYALWPRLSSTQLANNTQTSTWFMRRGDFLRLKSVELGFSMPQSWISKLQLSTARLYFNGINLLTFSGFDLWDIEMGGNGLGYPIQMTLNTGIHVTF